MFWNKPDKAFIVLNNRSVRFLKFKRFPTDSFESGSKTYSVHGEDILPTEKPSKYRYLLYLPNEIAPYHIQTGEDLDTKQFQQNAMNMLDRDHTVHELQRITKDKSLLYLLMFILGAMLAGVILLSVILGDPKVFHLMPIGSGTSAHTNSTTIAITNAFSKILNW